MFRLIIASTFLASFIGFTIPTSAQDEVKVIRAGQLLDVTNGRMLSDQLIIVRNNVIEAVGDANRINIPSGAIEIDLSNSTILPGLIDAHVHLTSDASVNGYDSLSRSSIRNALYGTYSAGLTLALVSLQCAMLVLWPMETLRYETALWTEKSLAQE